MNAFARPTTVDEAITLMASMPYRLLAGGTDIYPGAGQHLGGPVLDLTGIQGLTGIKQNQGLWIGAATTWTQIASADLPSACAALQQAALQVGGRQIQNVGTIAGNLCNASPAADGVPPLLVLDAEVELAGPKGRRSLQLADFLKGPRKTARDQDEIVTGIRIPAASLVGRSSFKKLGARAYLVISIAMVAARVDTKDGYVADVSIAVGSCSATAVRLTDLEDRLRGCAQEDIHLALTSHDLSSFLSPIDDVRASAGYRLTAAKSLIAAAVQEAMA